MRVNHTKGISIMLVGLVFLGNGNTAFAGEGFTSLASEEREGGGSGMVQSTQVPKVYEGLKESEGKPASRYGLENEDENIANSGQGEEVQGPYFEWADSPLFQRLAWIVKPDAVNTSFRNNIRALLKNDYIRSEILDFLSKPSVSRVAIKNPKQLVRDIMDFADEIDIESVKDGSMERKLILGNKLPDLDMDILLFAQEVARGTLKTKRGNGLVPIKDFDPHISGVIMLRMLFEYRIKLQPRQLERLVKDFAMFYLMDKVNLMKMEKEGSKAYKTEEKYGKALLHIKRNIAFSKSILGLFMIDVPFSQESLAPAREEAEKMYPE